MTAISLRSYLREVEILVDQGKFPDAVKHCKHILKFHPKYIDAYRILGKAYLENQQFSEAADIFQRVLSVIPDDFVAQIGMSIIREDEGNLDAAIWHIERAFEVNPSNSTIQDEIRRLYGRRDGIHLTKIRLTKGALIRMYLQGELFSQAIAEARSALAEDPQRVDLEVLLARLYFQSGKKVESAEICAQIVNKLPYCLEANKIFSIILSSMNRDEEAKVFQKRIYVIEPYAAFISMNTPTITQVPDNVILLERFDLDHEEADRMRQPDWAQSIGVNLDNTPENTLPDWLPTITDPMDETDQAAEFSSQLEETGIEEFDLESLDLGEDDDIPDWMKTVGWNQTSQTEEMQSNTKSNEEILPLVNDETRDAQTDSEESGIPDWLEDLNPAGKSQQNEIESISPSNPEDKISFMESQPAEQQPFDEIDEAMEWLETFEGSTVSDREEFESVPEKTEEIPDEWVKEYELPEEEQLDRDSLPGLSDKKITEPPVTEETHQDAQGSKKSDFDKDMLDENQEDGFAWLESLAAKQGADEETLTTAPEERKDEIPSWISEYTNTDSENDVLPKLNEAETSVLNENEVEEIASEFALESLFEDTEEKPDVPIEKTNEATAMESPEMDGKVQDESKAEKFTDYTLSSNEPLSGAIHSINSDDISSAVNQFNAMISNNENIPSIIDELEKALETHPVEAQIWQCLADAYAKNNQLQKALEAYSKAEELLF